VIRANCDPLTLRRRAPVTTSWRSSSSGILQHIGTSAR
jgi:hypothetical protein